MSLFSLTFVADDLVTAVHGTLVKIDRAGRVIGIKTDGADHTFELGKHSAVHGARATDVAAKDTWHGGKERSEVVLHATMRGTEDIAIEVDNVGDESQKRTEATVKEVDRKGQWLVLMAADGTEHTFRLTTHAAMDGGKELTTGMEKGAMVAVYSTDEAGIKVAHFFERI